MILTAALFAADPVVGSEPSTRSVNIAANGSGAGSTVTYGNGSYFTLGGNKFEGKKLPMSIVADALARFALLRIHLTKKPHAMWHYFFADGSFLSDLSGPVLSGLSVLSSLFLLLSVSA